MRFQNFLEQTLQELAAQHILRQPDDGSARRAVADAAAQLGVSMVDASSNDYLGLASRPVPRETFASAGTAASRLVHGTAAEHLQLETRLAAWVRCDASLLFSSTYAANVGLLSALGVSESVLISDAANHASIVDGARLARAQVRVTPHLDLDAVRSVLRESRQSRACWVVTESYFSMDGDGPDLPALRALCDEYDACLIVDEAHALGVFGPGGAGRCAEANVAADGLAGALGKAVGAHGGFIAGSQTLRTFLWNKARSFVFSTAPSPSHTQLTLDQLVDVQAAEGLRGRLHANTGALRQQLRAAGIEAAEGSFGPIVSIVLGDNERAVKAATHLRAHGILAQAIRPPSVPKGAARLRVTVKATFSALEISRLTRAIESACLAS